MALYPDTQFSRGAAHSSAMTHRMPLSLHFGNWLSSKGKNFMSSLAKDLALSDEEKQRILFEAMPQGPSAFQEYVNRVIPQLILLGAVKDSRTYTEENFIIARIMPDMKTDHFEMRFEVDKPLIFPPQLRAEGTRVENPAYKTETSTVVLHRYEFGGSWWREAEINNLLSFQRYIDSMQTSIDTGWVYRKITLAMNAILEAPYLMDMRAAVLNLPRPVSLRSALNLESNMFGVLNQDLPWGISYFYQTVVQLYYHDLQIIAKKFDTVMLPRGTGYLTLFGGNKGDTRTAAHWLTASSMGVNRAHSLLHDANGLTVGWQLPKDVEFGEWDTPKVDAPDPGMHNPLRMLSYTGAFFVFDLQDDINTVALTKEYIARRGQVRVYSRAENGIATFHYADAVRNMNIFDPMTGEYTEDMHKYLTAFKDTGFPRDAYELSEGNVHQYLQRTHREEAMETHNPEYYTLIKHVGDRERMFQSYEYDKLHAEVGAILLKQRMAENGFPADSLQKLIALVRSMANISINTNTSDYFKELINVPLRGEVFILPSAPSTLTTAPPLPEWRDGFPTVALGYPHAIPYLYDIFTSGEAAEWVEKQPKFVEQVREAYPVLQELHRQVKKMWPESELLSANRLPVWMRTYIPEIDEMTALVIVGFGIPMTTLWLPKRDFEGVPEQRDIPTVKVSHYVAGLLAGKAPEANARDSEEMFNSYKQRAQALDIPAFSNNPEQAESQLLYYFIWTNFTENSNLQRIFGITAEELNDLQEYLRGVLEVQRNATVIQAWIRRYESGRSFGLAYQQEGVENSNTFLYLFAQSFVAPYFSASENLRSKLKLALAIQFFRLLKALDQAVRGSHGRSTQFDSNFYEHQRRRLLNQLQEMGEISDFESVPPTSSYINSRLVGDSAFLAQRLAITSEVQGLVRPMPTNPNSASLSLQSTEELNEWIKKTLGSGGSRWMGLLFPDAEEEETTGIVTLPGIGCMNHNMCERIDALLTSGSSRNEPLEMLAGLSWLLSPVNLRTLLAHFVAGLPTFAPTIVAGWPAIEFETDGTVFALADASSTVTSEFETSGAVFTHINYLRKEFTNEAISEGAMQIRVFTNGHVMVPGNILIWPHSLIRHYVRGWGRESILPEKSAFAFDDETGDVRLHGDMVYMDVGPDWRRSRLREEAFSLGGNGVFTQRVPGMYEHYEQRLQSDYIPMQHYYRWLMPFGNLMNEPPQMSCGNHLLHFHTLTPMLPITHDYPSADTPDMSFKRCDGWSVFDKIKPEELQNFLTRYER